ncbi:MULTISPECIES: pyrroline-5-carboxylate reductase [Francisella]|uniref:Pyrroline-5-carboxylate reductase n=1 Tax=Francisella opportunistica TaxID=2016517 RepID=A0A345JPX7_9GAMM|nr:MULTISPECIES: pyrroline-5-carboxylate reductase [Francisella]APC91056.1 Pyrroline-5-carboxylate reductase [Francisella sp. MA067296]AXH29373.1 pyrroline-5-carboxylate reductase [Francisella opportunistica]AXH31024.1 pyrroline-5-carboxylate reductase [Francisella opportunistica]AXH32671.1 pyrroline-5-carboxylate reductase [Francisella opportunistica]
MKICFIGGGNMAAAMIAGMTSHGYKSQDIIVFDRNEHKRLSLYNKYNIGVSNSLLDTVKCADILILAIKPQNMPDLIKDIRESITSRQVIVTVAAGIQTNAYERLFNKEISFARTIPNTPSSLGYGATGIYFNGNITANKKAIVIDIMQTIGIVTVVKDEKEIDIIAAIASSGPAYYFQFMEHMVNAAVKQGLDKSQAEKLVAQTCLGAAQMALNSDEDMSALRKNVTSKKGITYEALITFEKFELGRIIDNAIQANIARAQELAKEFSTAIIS